MGLPAMVILVSLGLVALFGLVLAAPQKEQCVVEQTYGLDATRTFGVVAKNSALMLVGAGMRRKFFLDVYSVGLFVSPKRHQSIKATYAKKGAIDTQEAISWDDYPFGLALSFKRAVGTNQVVDALVEALSSSSTSEKDFAAKVAQFKTALVSKIGSTGTNVGDEIEFLFKSSNAEVGIRFVPKGGSASKLDSIKSKTLRDKLLDVYLNKEKSVAPELLTSIDATYRSK